MKLSQAIRKSVGNTVIVGIGGAGSNMVGYMASREDNYIYITVNTQQDDSCSDDDIYSNDDITNIILDSKIEINRSDQARELIESKGKAIVNHIIKHEPKLIVLLAGLGGKAGSEGVQVLSNILRNKKIHLCIIVVKPFMFEGRQRSKCAYKTIDKIRRYPNTLIILDNNSLDKIHSRETTLFDVFNHTNKYILNLVKMTSKYVPNAIKRS